MKAIITGSTGMVGKSVLLECLEHEKVQEVLLINRHPIDIKHKKIKEVILKDFANIESIKGQLAGYDACFHCMGISSIGKSEEEYSKVTYDYTKGLVDVLYDLNKDMVVNYVTGEGTDRTEQGNTMWARVKGKTENYILTKGFKDAYMFRPGAIIPEKGIKSNTFWYNIIYVITRPIFPLLKKRDSITTTTKLGLAMINTVLKPQAKKILLNKDISEYAEK